ncbi:MAG: Holliday junction resolvase RuvX [Gammaproteobacteria bacterium]
MQSGSILTYFGIDFGTRKIGVAVGQTLTRTAMGIAIVPVHANVVDWDLLDKLVQQWKPGAFVVGMPYSMDGTDNDMTARARNFAKLLGARYGKPCHEMDERLSTRAAREISRDNAERIGKRYDDRTKVDALAAQLLLESWFEMGQSPD